MSRMSHPVYIGRGRLRLHEGDRGGWRYLPRGVLRGVAAAHSDAQKGAQRQAPNMIAWIGGNTE
jgi:hypothetical protein